MDIFKKITDGLGVRNELIKELDAAGNVLLSWEDAGCDSCGECSACDSHREVPWEELEMFFKERYDAAHSNAYFNRAEEIEGWGELEFASFLIGVPGLFEFLEKNGFNGLDGTEMDSVLDAVANVVKDGPIEEAEVFFGGEFWLTNFWLRKSFYSRAGSSTRWALLEEEVGKAREELFYDAEAVKKFSLDDLLAEPYYYDDPDNLFPESPVGSWGDIWEDVMIGDSYYTVLLEMSGREYPFKFSPNAIVELASLSGKPASVVEALMREAGLENVAWKAWPWFYSVESLWNLIEAALVDGGIGSTFVKEAFGPEFISERVKWVYSLLIKWIKDHRVFWGTKEENSILVQAAKSPYLEEEGARLIEDSLGSYWEGPNVWRALAGNSCAPLRLLKDLASDNLDLGVPELQDLARDAIARKEAAIKEEAVKKEEYIVGVLSGEVPLTDFSI